ncbi:MAG: FAD-dependent oxidoreductase [Chloroflexi bacterium]|nr:FAD-dependent oxidoreductase [Chloroflexota bacterium]
MFEGKIIEWPYRVDYAREKDIETDVLILGGGIAGCWAAIAAAGKGARVVIFEKGATITSGAGGGGADHWGGAVTGNPRSSITAEEYAEAELRGGRYGNGIMAYIQGRESYETLLELEKMGGKVRDTDDVFKGSEFRDEKTKILYADDYTNGIIIRVWGTTFKPALYKECKRLGVKIYDRVMSTSLLNEDGRQGKRVVGATGLNMRTGEFMVCKAKATILANGRPSEVWEFTAEQAGSHTHNFGEGGSTIAWRAGAEFTMMEKTTGSEGGLGSGGFGSNRNTWFACNTVDDDGKEIPWLDRDGNILKTVSERYRPALGQKFFTNPRANTPYEYVCPSPAPIMPQLRKGEFNLPLYADLPGMPELERRAIFGLMVGQECKTKLRYKVLCDAGFDPDKDLAMMGSFLTPGLFGYQSIGKSGFPAVNTWGGRRGLGPGSVGGVVADWNLKTSLDGLYAAGDCLFGSYGHAMAATCGKYAGRNAVEYLFKAGEVVIDQKQVEAEKARVYASTKRREGRDWKELYYGINKVMQLYCGNFKTERLMHMGLMFLEDLNEAAASELYANNPHKLGRTLEALNVLDYAQAIMHASLARKASSLHLSFYRTDYPEIDPPEWNKFITIRLENEQVKVGELPLDYWGDYARNYKVSCQL